MRRIDDAAAVGSALRCVGRARVQAPAHSPALGGHALQEGEDEDEAPVEDVRKIQGAWAALLLSLSPCIVVQGARSTAAVGRPPLVQEATAAWHGPEAWPQRTRSRSPAVRRERLAEWLNEPFFEDTLPGCMVRSPALLCPWHGRCHGVRWCARAAACPPACGRALGQACSQRISRALLAAMARPLTVALLRMLPRANLCAAACPTFAGQGGGAGRALRAGRHAAAAIPAVPGVLA